MNLLFCLSDTTNDELLRTKDDLIFKNEQTQVAARRLLRAKFAQVGTISDDVDEGNEEASSSRRMLHHDEMTG